MTTEATPSSRCRGMRDLSPADMARFRAVEDAFRDVVAAWGYDEIRTPTIEHLHLFTGAGTLSPQMLRRVYSFLDWDGWSGERVVLRPDATIPVARLYGERYAPGADARLAYVQNVFRFEEGDDSREDWQCGVERLGAGAPDADLELVLLGLAVIRRLALPSPRVRLSHTGVVRAILARAGLTPDEQLAHYDRLLDGDLSGLGEVEARLPGLAAPLSLLFEVEGDRSYLANLRAAFAGALPEITGALDELALVAEALDAFGEPYTLTSALARNFEYYTGIVFRFDADGARVGGGGRYDGLLRLVAGADIPASGFALDIEAILALLPEQPAAPATVTVRAGRREAVLVAKAHAVAATLRAHGLRTTMNGASSGGEVIVEAAERLVWRDGRGGETPYAGVEALAAALAARHDGRSS